MSRLKTKYYIFDIFDRQIEVATYRKFLATIKSNKGNNVLGLRVRRNKKKMNLETLFVNVGYLGADLMHTTFE